MTAEDPGAIAVADVIALQRSMIATRPSLADSAGGFLIGRWAEDDLVSIVRGGGVLHVVVDASGVAAFAVETGLAGAHGLVDERYEPRLTMDESAELRGERYLAQIGVRVSARRSGLGRLLVRAVCAQSLAGVVADVVVSPVCNEASLAFFRALGFRRVGELSVARYPGFGPNTSEVLRWTNSAP